MLLKHSTKSSEPSAGEREGPAPRMRRDSAGEREGPAPRMRRDSAGEREERAPRMEQNGGLDADAHVGAAAGMAVDRYAPAVRLAKLMGYGQSQAAAAGGRAG